MALSRSLPEVPDTLFPPLDTQYHGPSGRPQSQPAESQAGSKASEILRAQIQTADVDLQQGLVFESYARFIRDITGHDAIAFYATEDSSCSIVSATLHDGDGLQDISWERVDPQLAPDAVLDFGLELCTARSSEEQNLRETRSSVIFNLKIIAKAEEPICDVELRFAPYALTAKDAKHIFEALLYCLREKSLRTAGTSGLEQSILNHPPVERPPTLPRNGVVTDDTPSLALLHREFLLRASEYPERPALDFLQSHASRDAAAKHLILSYAELDFVSTRIANRIAKIVGSQPTGQLAAVPVFLSTSAELYISYVSILKAGLAFCPLPVDAPPQRLQSILEDLQPSLVLGVGAIDEKLLAVFDLEDCNVQQPQWLDVRQFLLGGAEYQPLSAEELIPSRQPSENDVAYIMYTSGSTGKPKGVQITHLAASCTIAAHAITAPINNYAKDVPRWFQFAAPTFDPSLMEIFVTFSSGGTLCAAPRDMSLTNMEATVTELRATVMMSTPSMAALLRPDRLPTLCSLWTMGETLLRKVIDNFSGRTMADGTPFSLVNAYGPTEASINCTLLVDFPRNDRGSIIGPALQTCSLIVLDPASRVPKPVLRGFAGELAIGGPQVSAGYINRPDQNERAFVESEQFGRLYRTGDKARIVTDSQGNYAVEFLGRIDTSEVKLSGRRVNLGEIDSVIAPSEGVKDVVTISHQRNAGQHGSEEAVAFIVLQEGEIQSAVETACRESCQRSLPAFMCPSRYFFISSIPRSPSGKVDRKALAELARQMWQSPASDTSSPTTDSGDRSTFGETSIDSTEVDDLSQLLCKILADVVGCPPNSVRPNTNLLSIGIDSLRAVRFLQDARDAGFQELGVVDILQSHTAAELADIIRSRRDDSTTGSSSSNGHLQLKSQDVEAKFAEFHKRHQERCAAELGISVEEIDSILPTTATQSGMLTSFIRSSSAHDQSKSKKKSYIHHSIHKLVPTIDVGKFKQSWTNVLQRHAIYRTVFLAADDSLSPFLQCTLSQESEMAKVQWHEIPENHDMDRNSYMQHVLGEIEEQITLDKPPFWIGLHMTADATYLVLSIFHALFDGASLHLLFDDVEAEYEGREIPKRTEVGTSVEAHYTGAQPETTDYWRKRLEVFDPTPFPCLTGIRPELAKDTTKVTTIKASVNMDHLKQGAKDNMASPLSILQAAWSLVLLAYKDSLGDSAFGSVISGRLDKASEVCVAPTFITVPVLIPSSEITTSTGPSSNSAIAQYISAANANSLQHLQIPLSALTTSSGTLHYDTLLAFQEFATSKDSCSLWESVEYPPMGNDFAVMIEIWPEDSGMLRLRATYSDTVLNEASASLMLTQLDDAIKFILNNPQKPYYTGRAVVPKDHLSISDPVSVPVIPGELLHTTFEEHAANHPDDLALIFRGNLDDPTASSNIDWTYKELDQKANILAQYLVDKYGDLRDKVVPFSLYKSPELYVAILGAIKAGAAWCPIDPTFPAQRRHDLIVRTDAQMLLVGGQTLLQEPNAVPNYVEMIDLSELAARSTPLGQFDQHQKILPAQPEHMAYLIWTSGTTGMPKGVQIQHHAAARSMRSLRQVIPRSKNNSVRCMQFSQPTFDVFVQDLFYTWGQGGTVISGPKDVMLGSFARLANTTKATHAHLTPAFSSTVARKDCETLEVITMIGEALPQPVADDWGTNMLAYNTYGPAEVSVVSTFIQFGGPMAHIKSVNVGWCLPSVAAYVMTAEGQPIIKGGVGELALAGPQLSRGYWKDTARTTERFFFNEHVKEQVYMTGDVVRQLHDGTLEFMGRRDDLVKLSGMRVELSEISFALSDCDPSVEQVVTMYMASSKRPKKVVVSFISVPELLEPGSIAKPVVNDKAVAVAEAALATAQKTLPEHMIPGVIIILGAIPFTASAKIDRNLMQRAYEDFDIDAWEQQIAPSENSQWSPEEQTFVDIIADFSGVAAHAISKGSRLPALGIDSIGAVRLASRLNSKGFAVPIIEVIRCNTVANLIDLLQSSQKKPEQTVDKNEILAEFNEKWSSAVAMYLGIEASSFKVVPTLPIQENLLSESFRQFDSYWSNHFYELHDGIDLAKLQDAWTRVTERTEALRTGFVLTAALNMEQSSSEEKPTFVQVVHKHSTLDWIHEHVSEEDFVNKAKERASAIAKHHQANLFRSPCWGVSILEHGDKRTMMFTLHHSLHDGPSLEFIASELQSAYLRSATGDRSQLSEAVATVSLSRCTPAENLKFWESELKDYVADDDATGNDASSDEAGYNTQEVPMSSDMTKLRAATEEFGGSSVASVIRAAWGCILAEFLEADEKRVVFAEVHSERILDQSLESAVAPLICVAPVPILAHGTAREIMRAHNKSATAAWKHRHINPSAIRKMLQRPQSQPLYPAVFVFHPETSDALPANELWDKAPDYLGLSVEHGLALNVLQQADGSLIMEVAARKGLLSNEGVHLLGRQVDALVTAMIDHPDEPIEELTKYFPRELISVTSPQHYEIDPVVSMNNPTCWLEHWAAVSPDWQAAEIATSIDIDEVVSEKWTYGQLNATANRIASMIRSRGIEKRAIAMCLGRTLLSFAIIAGIFKSGNVYLPLDEGLPDDRKLFLLSDSNVRILFASKDLQPTGDGRPEDCEFIDVEDPAFLPDLEKYDSANPQIQTSPDDELYLLYTSGSTGLPKGVIITRSNLTAFIECDASFIASVQPACLELGGIGKFLCLASRAFDVHLAEVFLAWKWGLCAVTGTRSMLLDDLALALKELHVTHAAFVPSLIDQVGLHPDDVPDLRYLSVGGEKISSRTLKTWGNHHRVALVNAYGPTEVTIGCTAALVYPDTNVRNIGRPLGDTIGHVLKPGTLSYVKRGMEGELCLTGSLVGKGYHKRPDAKGFVEDFNGERMYRTGDLVRLMPDDSIEIFGRSDDQTKIRGQRLELGEVSECVRRFATETGDVSTLILKHPELSKPQLVSFFAHTKKFVSGAEKTTVDKSDKTAAAIREGCKQKLPAYMVPDFIIPLEFFPLAALSGKADVKQLKGIFASIPLQDLLGSGASNANEESESRPLTDQELEISQVLQTIVSGDISNIKPNTNIFEVGIDSLSAISLAAKLRQIGYDCTVANVLDSATIEKLANIPKAEDPAKKEAEMAARAEKILAEAEERFKLSSIDASLKSKIERVLPCLPLQEAVVVRSLNNESSLLYVNHVVLRLAESIDLAKLRQAWADSASSNEILRTFFCQIDNDILQAIISPTQHSLSWSEGSGDLSSISQTWQMKIAKDIIGNIQNTPPLRINIFTSSEEAPLFCLSVHHALYDAESLTMLLQDINTRYQGEPEIKRPNLSSMVAYLKSQDEEVAKTFWTQMLQGYRPTKVADGSSEEEKTTVAERALKVSLTDLETCASKLKTTLPTLAQTIFGLAMAQAVGINDFVFGLVLSGRSVPVVDVDKLLAPCITTVPQRVDLRKKNAALLDILSTTQASAGQLIEHQHTSLRNIHRWVHADRPLFDSLFSFIKTNGDAMQSSLWSEVDSHMPSDYPFAIECEARQASNDLVLRAGYAPSFGSASKVAGLLEMMELLIEKISQGENPRVEELGIQPGEIAGGQDEEEADDGHEWTNLELTIRDALVSLADVDVAHVSRTTTFFRLGIDSVISIRFAQRLRKAGLKVSSSDILKYPCISALTAHLSKKEVTPKVVQSDLKPEPEVNVFVPFSSSDSLEAIYDCTPLQIGTLSQTITSDGRMYVHHHAIRLSKSIDLVRLKEAWSKLVSTHDILRTTFHMVERTSNPWVAAVHRESFNKWTDRHVTNDLESAMAEIVQSVAYNNAEAFRRPAWEVTVLRASEHTVLVVSMHHSLYDGWCLPLLFQEFGQVYLGEALPASVPFSQAAKAITQSQAESVEFWYKKLVGYNSIELPSSPSEGLALTEFVVPLSTSVLLDKCKQMNITLQTAALLAFGKAMCCLVGRRDVVFGQVLSGRSLPIENVENVMGPLFNTLPIRATLANSLLTNEAAASRLQQEIAEGQDFQHAPLGAIQTKWRQSANGTKAALIDSLFVFQKSIGGQQEPSGQLWEPFESGDDKDATEYGLNCEIEQGTQDVTFRASSPAGRLGLERLNAFLKDFNDALLDIINSPSRSVTAFPSIIAELPVSTENNLQAVEDDEADEDPATVDIIRKALSDISNIGISSILPKTSIYTLGVDSILAIQVASACRRAGLRLRVADILQGQTPNGIARIMRENAIKSKSSQIKTVSISDQIKSQVLEKLRYNKEDVVSIVPCLPGQVYHLAGWLNSGRTFYEPIWPWIADGKLIVEKLQQAWKSLQERYPILRTVFTVIGTDEAYQTVLKSSTISDETFVTVGASGDLTQFIKSFVREESRKPNDLFTPPVKLILVQGDSQDAVLVKLHHSTYDPTLMAALTRDLVALYSSSDLPPVADYSKFVLDTQSSLQSRDQKSYWQNSLQLAKPTLIKSSRPEPSAPLAQTFVLIKGAVSNISSFDELCRSKGISLSTLVTVAFGRAVAAETGSSDAATFGFYHAARSDDAENVPGPCVNLLPLVVPTKTDVKSTTEKLQTDLNTRVNYEQSDLRQVSKWANTSTPLFNTYLNLLWHKPTPKNAQGKNADAFANPLLKPINIGFPTDFASTEPLPGVTAVDGLDTSFLARENLFCDVGPNWETDTLDFGVKADAVLMNEDKVRDFVQNVAQELEKCVSALKG